MVNVYKTEIARRAFGQAAPSVLNSLPAFLGSIKQITEFKKCLCSQLIIIIDNNIVSKKFEVRTICFAIETTIFSASRSGEIR